ncbi:hypothetical protein PVD82_005061 [Enterobacter hormaechei]|nr:hypothetical protein [Enterobacter hormaechei]EKM7551635.1 hypothetical protein [Enterobacter hormaechei]EKV5294917.1 hypothetical protein [Enterobacter hormaechei]EKW8463259.1 hypothetical protein [Enterobacter hormaechei]
MKKTKIDIQKLEYIDQRMVVLEFQQKTDLIKKDRDFSLWVDINNIKPIDLYCYLQVRFGKPNGLQNLFRSDDSDNLIHWDYLLDYEGYRIHIMCMTYRLEIHKSIDFQDQKHAKDEFINDLKNDFKNYGKEISKYRSHIETWHLFINPFKRIKTAIETNLAELEELKVSQIKYPDFKNFNKKTEKEMEIVGAKFAKANTLGINLSLTLPIYAESFINFLIFTLAKVKASENQAEYESFIRSPINQRVKNLHLKCIGFNCAVDYDNNDSCKEFQSIMNIRNEMLHGNVNPNTNHFDTVYFEGKVPLFAKFTSLAFDSYIASQTGIEFETLLKRYESIQNFISYILTCLETAVAQQIIHMLDEPFPGWNPKTKRLGKLFSDKAVDFQFDIGKKIKIIY